MCLHSERKAACRDGVDLVSRWVLRARERGVSNTLLGDQRVYGRRDRIGLESMREYALGSMRGRRLADALVQGAGVSSRQTRRLNSLNSLPTPSRHAAFRPLCQNTG